MAHTFVCNHMHIVFSTRDRAQSIKGDRGKRLYAYLIGIARNLGMTMIAVGGMPDHIHLLVSLPSQMSVAKAVNLFKSNSSKWMNEQKPGFAWQTGYGAFSVSASNLDSVKEYVLTQEEHHRKRDFKQELVVLLRKHRVDFDPQHLWD